jgi:hypothetical protein
MVRRPFKRHGNRFQHITAECARYSGVLDFPDSGSADFGTSFNFFAGDVNFLDASSKEPGEHQSGFREHWFFPAFIGLTGLAFSFACHENPPLLATRTSRRTSGIATHAKPRHTGLRADRRQVRAY